MCVHQKMRMHHNCMCGTHVSQACMYGNCVGDTNVISYVPVGYNFQHIHYHPLRPATQYSCSDGSDGSTRTIVKGREKAGEK